jgi:hypothetical protein
MTSNIFLSLLYAGAYIFSYIYYLHGYFEYLHFPLYNRTDVSWVWAMLLVIIPASIIGNIKNASSVFSAFTYILIYVPTIITMQLAYEGIYADLFLAQLTFLVAMIALLLVAKLEFTVANVSSRKKDVFGKILVSVALAAVCYIVISYGNNLSFVSLEDVYIHRAQNAEIGAVGLIGYIISWTSAFVVPVLIAVGISRRNNIYIAVGCFASIVIYMAEASKGTLLMPIILYLLHFLIAKFGVNNLYKSTMLSLSIVMIAGTAYVLKYDLSAPLTMIVAIVIMRVVATGGILNTIYFEYFQNNPKTYLSQYGMLDKVFQAYPYQGEPVGYVIGREYVSEGMNVNANFWASDGLMNAGLPGVLLVTVAVCIFFVVLNRSAKNCPLSLASLLILIFFSTAANASFFQALWSGGGIFMLLSFKYLKHDRRNPKD